MARHIICRVEELQPGQRRVLEIGGRSIGVFNVGGEYYALRNLCPHRSAPLCLGRVRPFVTPGDGAYPAHEREGEVLKCPWHQWEFDIKSGQALFDSRLRVRTFSVTIEADQVIVEA